MKKAVQFYTNVPLVLRIAVGLLIGVILGVCLPTEANFIAIFGDIFVGALKAIAPLLVFVLVIASLASAGKGIGGRFKTVVVFYMLSTFLAAAVAVVGSYLFRVTIPLGEAATNAAPESLLDVFKTLFSNMVSNPIGSIASGNYTGILFWAVVLGLALRSASEATKNVLTDLSSAVSKAVAWVIQLAPFGIMGLVFSSVGEYGIAIFVDYGKILLLLVGCMLAVALIIDPLIVAVSLKKNPYPLVLKCFRESGLTAFFTRSSAANIPVNMKLCEKLGLDPEYYSVAIPLGATINMDGAAITITVMSLAAAFSQGIEVNILFAILLSFVATLGACGASGVAGGSLLLIPMACSLLGVGQDIAMQVVSVGFIIGVVQDSLETAINSSGDVIFCATAEYREKQKRGEEIHF